MGPARSTRRATALRLEVDKSVIPYSLLAGKVLRFLARARGGPHWRQVLAHARTTAYSCQDIQITLMEGFHLTRNLWKQPRARDRSKGRVLSVHRHSTGTGFCILNCWITSILCPPKGCCSFLEHLASANSGDSQWAPRKLSGKEYRVLDLKGRDQPRSSTSRGDWKVGGKSQLFLASQSQLPNAGPSRVCR
jgi:hypothetical protein